MDKDLSFDAVADELYGLAPEEFTAARDARASEARAAKDRPLATAIKGLRRPTASAWLANLLVRHRRDQLEKLLALGEALQAAQSTLAADDLRRLSQQRHQVVAGLARDARRLAADMNHPVGEPAARELESTLEAALSDPGAAQELRAGRLVSALQYSGLGIGETAAPARSGSGTGKDPVSRPAPARRANEKADAADPSRADEQARREREARAARQAEQAEARQALEAAETAVAEATERRDSQRRRADEAANRVDDCDERIRALEEELRSARAERVTAVEEAAAAVAELEEAEASVADAAADREQAAAALARLPRTP